MPLASLIPAGAFTFSLLSDLARRNADFTEDMAQAAGMALLGLGDGDKRTISTARYHPHSCLAEAGTSAAWAVWEFTVWGKAAPRQ